MVKGHHGHKKKELNGHQSWVIGHHLAQVEEVPTNSYWDINSDGLTDGISETQDILILIYLLYTRF